MMLQLYLIILSISFTLGRATNDVIHYEINDEPKNVGDFCRNTKTGSNGICTHYRQCPALLQTPRSAPSICSIQNQIVCCPTNQTNSMNETQSRVSEKYCSKVLPTRSGDDILIKDIVNGNLVEKDEFPFMVGLAVFTDSSPGIKIICGGTLISDRFVVTAAHCFKDERPEFVIMGIKSFRERRFVVQRSLEKIIIHPEYKFNRKYNDIALIKLNESVIFNDKVRPACLWQTKKFDESHVQTAGWGDTSFFGSASEHLLEVTLEVISKRKCEQHFPSSIQIPDGIVDSQLCAGHFDKDACQGDSGGPLTFKKLDGKFYNNYLVGITSFGKGCAHGSPGVYTNIAYFLDWIEGIVWP